MRRRDLIIFLAGAMATWPLGVGAQESKLPVGKRRCSSSIVKPAAMTAGSRRIIGPISSSFIHLWTPPFRQGKTLGSLLRVVGCCHLSGL